MTTRNVLGVMIIACGAVLLHSEHETRPTRLTTCDDQERNQQRQALAAVACLTKACVGCRAGAPDLSTASALSLIPNAISGKACNRHPHPHSTETDEQPFRSNTCRMN